MTDSEAVWSLAVPRRDIVNGFGWRAGRVMQAAILFGLGWMLVYLTEFTTLLPYPVPAWLPYGLLALSLLAATRPLWDQPNLTIAHYLLTSQILVLRNGGQPVQVIPLDQITRMEGFSHYITLYLADGSKGSMQGIRDPQAIIALIRATQEGAAQEQAAQEQAAQPDALAVPEPGLTP